MNNAIVNVALDTSLGFAIAIEEASTGKVLLSEHLSAVGRESDRLLTPWVTQSLAKVGSSLKDVRRWTLGTGPGSFAGLRCGIAMAKGAALASGAILRGVPSAYALAASAPEDLSLVGVLHDGRCGELLLERFERLPENDAWKMLGDSEPLKPERLLDADKKCDGYLTLQPEILQLCSESVAGKTTVLPQLEAAALLHAPESLYPWPTDWAGCEKSTEPLYVRQAVFVKPAELRHSS